MKSRKLRALALLLSAIMIITAVPSTLFAFESVDGEVVGWDQETEAPAEDLGDSGLGFDYEVEEAPLAAEDFDFFAADELVEATNAIASEDWYDNGTVKITYTSNSAGTKTYTVSELKKTDADCTKAVAYLTVDDPVAGHLEIQSDVARDYDGDGNSDVYVNKGTTRIAVVFPKDVTTSTTAEAKGQLPSGENHEWEDQPVQEDLIVDCLKTEYYAKFKCKKCKTYTYDTTVVTEGKLDDKSKQAAKVEVAGNGHTKPDAKDITTEILVDETTTKTAKANDSKGTYYVQNSVKDADNNVTPKDPAIDCYWVVKTSYTCPKCEKPVVEYEQFDKVVRKIGFRAVTDGNAEYNPNATNTDTWYTGVYKNDNFRIADCTKNNGEGKYEEVWFTGDFTEQTITHTILHTVKAHSATTSYFKTVVNGKNIKVDSILTTLTNDDMSGAAIPAKDSTGKLTGYSTSKTCVPYQYYEVVRCDVCKKILSVTLKEAAGDDKAHVLSPGAGEIAKKDIKTYVFKEPELTAATKLGGVSFKNKTYTCNKQGLADVYYICPSCKKEIYYAQINVLGDDHKYTWRDIEPKQDPTCTEDGFVTQQYICSVCDAVHPTEKTRTAVVPKLNHKGIDKVKPIYISIANGGDIVGELTVGQTYDDATINVKTTENVGSYDNKKVINAKLYKICPLCNKPVYDADLTTPAVEDRYNTVSYTVDAIALDTKNCSNGTITITVKSKDNTANPATPLSVTGTFDYWRDNNAYQARTQHAPKENADGSIVCVICGKVIKEAPVVTTVAPTTVEPTTVVTTEAPTTVAPTTVAPTTTAPTTTAPTTEAPVVPTTVAPVVEPTTEITTEQVTMPAQVTGEKVTKNSPTTGTIGVKYNAVDGADSYTVNVREPNGAWKKNPTNGAETAYDITGLTEGKCYDIRIAAVAGGIAGPRSGHLYRWLKKVTLMKPTKIKGEAGAVNVTWDAADGASLYKLYVSSDKAFKKDVQKIKAAENTAKVTGLKAGTKYYFKVRCYTKAADGKTYTGGWSNVKSKTLK